MLAPLIQASTKSIAKTQIKFKIAIDKLIEKAKEDISNQIKRYVCNVNTSNSTEQINKKITEIQAAINKIIKTRNTLLKILDAIKKIFKTLSVVTKIFEVIVTVFEIIIQILKALPIPNLYTTAGIVLTLSDVLEKGKDLISKIKNSLKQVNKMVSQFAKFIQELIDKLKLLDGLVVQLNVNLTNCAAKHNIKVIGGLDVLDSTTDNITLDDSMSQSSNDSYKGFTFKIKIDLTNKTKYVRRYAVGIDVFGVEVLKGEPSFSSSTEVLIDELKFYIDSNNLTAL